MDSIILASQSPRRKQILQALHLQFTTQTGNVNERVDKNLAEHDIVMEIGKKKIEAVLPHIKGKKGVIIASDTIVVYQNEILGKPRSREHGSRMLETLSGNTHRVYSSLVIYDTKKLLWVLDFDYAEVTFKKLDQKTISNYLEKIYFLDKAGSYGIQELGETIIESIEGDYFVVMGFPVKRFKYRMKEHFSLEIDDKDLYTAHHDEIYRFTNRKTKIEDE